MAVRVPAVLCDSARERQLRSLEDWGTQTRGSQLRVARASRGYLADGKTLGRARVVRRPLTVYQRYQLDWGIPGNIDAGEDIRILDMTDLDLDLPDQDFWLFDDEIVVHLNFESDGTLINVDQLENPDLLQYRKWRDTALAHAVPFSEFDART